MCPRNPYEAQIFAAWGSAKGERIERLTYYRDDKNLISMSGIYAEFFKATVRENSEASFQNDYEKKKKPKEMQQVTFFEFDFYVKPIQKSSDGVFYPMEKSVPEFFRDGTSVFRPINEIARRELNVVKPLQWILTEISDSPRQLVNKLFQIERALRLCPELEVMGVSAVMVLLNGWVYI